MFLMWGSNSSLLRERLHVYCSLPIVSHQAGGGVYGEIGSQPLLPASMWIFFLFTQCVQVTGLVFKVFIEEIVSYVAVDLLYP